MPPVEGSSTGGWKQDNFDDLALGSADRSPARGTFVLNKDISTQVGRRHRLKLDVMVDGATEAALAGLEVRTTARPGGKGNPRPLQE